MDIRYALVPLQTKQEVDQLRLFLLQNGFTSPTWFDSSWHQVREDNLETTTMTRSSPHSNWTMSTNNTLTLPTILVDSTPAIQAMPPTATATAVIVSPICVPVSRPSVLTSVGRPSIVSVSLSTSDEESLPPLLTPEPLPLTIVEEPSPAEGDGIFEPRAWVNPAPLRPRGKKLKPHEDPNVYFTCQLCKNRILGTRVSNLQNHVRRHSTLKQFQCRYCNYAHNEIAKVRLHMAHNHKDPDTPPINNVNIGMRSIWRSLFRECFPTRALRRRGRKQTLSPAQTTNPTSTSGISLSQNTTVPLSMSRRPYRRLMKTCSTLKPAHTSVIRRILDPVSRNFQHRKASINRTSANIVAKARVYKRGKENALHSDKVGGCSNGQLTS